VHMRSRLVVTANVRYDGSTTFLIECQGTGNPSCADLNANPSGPSRDLGALQVMASLTPVCRVSQGTGCAQTFGQTGGDVLAFSVGPNDPTAAREGGIFTRGANIEIDAILTAHGRLRNENPENWYGIFIANGLDFNQNPQIFPVTSLRANLPPGFEDLFSLTAAVQVLRWREVF